MREAPDRRALMIAQTSAWLSWALAQGEELPRIPRRAVGQGGFDDLLQWPGARAAVRHWWMTTLERIGG